MHDEKVKVNFTLKPESKEMLNYIKKEVKLNISTFLDDILKFDDEAIQTFFNIYKNINKERTSKYNYLTLEDGGIILNRNTMDKVLNSNIAILSDKEAVEKGVEAINQKYNKSYQQKNNNEKIDVLEKAILSVHLEFQKQAHIIKELQEKIENKE